MILLFTFHGIIKFSMWNGMRHYENKNYTKSILNLERVINYYPKKIGKFYLLLGMMHYDLNNNDKAIYYIRKAKEINPKHNAPKDLLKLIKNNSN